MSVLNPSKDFDSSNMSKMSFPYDQADRTDFRDAKFGDKIFLGAGELQGENNQTYKFEVVKKAEEKMATQTWSEDYLPPEGDKEFICLARDFLFGVKNIEEKLGKKIVSFQTIGATGAVRLAFSFIKKYMDGKVLIPRPTWPLAKMIAEEVGMSFEEFDFFDAGNQEIKFDNLMNILKSAPNKSFLFMQDIANIPGGTDMTMDQWTKILNVIKERQMGVIIDSAFQGFSTGDFETDSQVIRLLLQENVPFFIAQTFSKTLGLYGERIGCLHVNLFEDAEKIKSCLEEKARLLWLSPNVHGARIVKTILQDPGLMKLWKDEFLQIYSRIKENRQILQDALIKNGVRGKWDNLTKQNGMFIFLPFNSQQIGLMKEKYHLYNLDFCKINLSSLNKNDIERLVRGIKEASENPGQ